MSQVSKPCLRSLCLLFCIQILTGSLLPAQVNAQFDLNIQSVDSNYGNTGSSGNLYIAIQDIDANSEPTLTSISDPNSFQLVSYIHSLEFIPLEIYLPHLFLHKANSHSYNPGN